MAGSGERDRRILELGRRTRGTMDLVSAEKKKGGAMAASINRQEVGAHVSGTSLRLGLYLPGIRAADGYEVRARIIHAADQFVPEVPPVEAPLVSDPSHPLGLWSLTLDLTSLAPAPGHFGTNGTYLYRYTLLRH